MADTVKIAVCDDEKNIRSYLISLIRKQDTECETVPVRKGGSLPATTKQSILPDIVTEHGIGLENVRDIAERYFGGVNIKVKGDVFHVTVMLPQGEVKDSK